jgi:hypothetical protein
MVEPHLQILKDQVDTQGTRIGKIFARERRAQGGGLNELVAGGIFNAPTYSPRSRCKRARTVFSPIEIGEAHIAAPSVTPKRGSETRRNNSVFDDELRPPTATVRSQHLVMKDRNQPERWHEHPCALYRHKARGLHTARVDCIGSAISRIDPLNQLGRRAGRHPRRDAEVIHHPG